MTDLPLPATMCAIDPDALGGPGTPGDTYLGMIRHNMTTIVAALKGQP